MFASSPWLPEEEDIFLSSLGRFSRWLLLLLLDEEDEDDGEQVLLAHEPVMEAGKHTENQGRKEGGG